MDTTLKLYKETASGVGVKPMPFPDSGDKQACLSDYKYSATRMSSAPNITATLKWPRCLDDEWSTSVFVSYNGERFFVKNTPSSSYDNTSCLYSHSLELVSERAVLDSVYFLNVPTTTSGEGDNSQGDSLSDSTEFDFSGDIHEFVNRLNKSLIKTGVGGFNGYSAVVDNGATSDTKLFSISNQYVTDVLKSAYELYNIPYYFVGKVIHFGNQQNIINTPPLEYGANNSLLSISKSNSNKQVVTRITGTGSDRNIPYYYPNPTPKGHLKLGGSSRDKYVITDEATFGSKVELEKPFGFFCGICDMLSTGPLTPVFEKHQNGTAIDLAKGSEYTLYRIQIKFVADNAGTSSTYLVPIKLDPRGNVLDNTISDYFIAGTLTYGNGDEQDIIVDNGVLKTKEAVSYYGGIEFTLTITILPPAIGENDSAIIYINPSYNNWVNDTGIEAVTEIANKFSLPISIGVSRARPGYIFIKNLFSHLGKPVVTMGKYFVRGTVLHDGSSIGLISINEDGEIYCGFLQSGEYVVECIYKLPWPITPDTVTITTQPIFEKKLLYSDGSALPTLDKIGLSLAEGCETSLGDELTQLVDYRVDVKKTLMPSQYRRTNGGNMWYNATNATNRDEWYGDVVFDNVYDSRHPVEYIHTDEEIYPTITGMKNYEGENIDTFLDIAFDDFDNNEIYPEDYKDEKLAGKYRHPYFFVKLKKTDGDNGFNLFDNAIEGETMKISFTTGHVAGCEFEIGVDEETQKNPVQVDANGDLVKDTNGNVIYSGTPQDVQQDTFNNEVWIALKKEDSTMGVMMPDTASQLVPLGDKREGGGDKFVILGINLPEAYITAAEDRLEQELIKYLKENNRERFSFSLKLSSIYLAENEAFAKTLNENSRVTLLYNDTSYTMYVTSYSLTVKESSALPEVTISINDELKVVRPKVKDVSLFIDSTDTKIKNVRKTIQNTNESIKTLSEGSNNISNQLNTLIGDDAWMSAREIAERVANPIDERVNTLIGTDINKSARTIATEVLAGASTGGDIDLSLYLSKSEAESTYATKESLETTNDNIDSIDTRLGKAETNISNNSNLLSQHSQKITTLQTEQKSQNDTIKQQGATILALDVEVDGVKGDVLKANKAIESIETELGDKADNSTVDSLSKDLVSTKAVVEIIAPQVNANAEAIKGKASQEEVNALSESVTTLEGSVEEISNRVDNKADKGDVQTLVSQINNKVEQTTYNNKVAELEASIKTNKDNIDNGIVYLEGYSEEKANEAKAAAKAYTDEEIAKVDTKADNALATANNVKKKADNNEYNIERLGQDVKDVENTLGTLNTTITQVGKKADNAVSTAESATTKAEEAKTTATEAKTTANSVSAQMSGVLTQVQNNTTQIGIIAKDYLRKDQAADFATDLTGVVEATAEEFVYRPSAGDKSIRDKSAVIRRIKGNSVVWEQKLKSPSDEGADWHAYTSSMLTTEIQGREMRCTLTGASVAINPHEVGITGLQLTEGMIAGHIYLFCAWGKVSYLNSSLGNHFAFENDVDTRTLYPEIDTINKWTFVSRIWQAPSTRYKTSTIRPPWSYTSANGAKVGDWYAIKDAMFFDLTAMFGEGNEPATVEEFRKVYNEAYYPYCQLELRGVKTGAIKTVGFNLFDGECARVIGGMSYIVSNYTSAYYSETKNGAQTAVLIKDGVYTPECSGYLYLEGSVDATPCVHFQHSGVMDGECAPYEEHTLNLPEILRLFPKGMHAVGDVYDEINIDTYIQRCEYRDYVEGDESNAEVLTDGVHTVAKLTNPIITPLSEPIALDYYCEDWGSEEAMPASAASAPFRADIVYQFNAEGRIRDNSRNIDKLEKIVTPLKNIPSNASLATQDFVYAHIPTRVATATERVVVTVGDEKHTLFPNGDEVQYLLPNMLYDYGATSYKKIELPNLLRGDVAFNNKWMVRFASGSSDAISIPFDVFWKDGIAPSWSAWCVCEMTFFKDDGGLYTFGEWKIYK